MTPNFVKRRGTKSNKSFDEVWCLQHNQTNEIIATEETDFYCSENWSRQSQERIVTSYPRGR